jgi:hypothetical protein
MKFKAGDKVKFLNSTGGGVVTRYGDRGVIFIEIEDGFEVPVMEADIVGVKGVTDHSGRMFLHEDQKGASPTAPIQDARTEARRLITAGNYPGNHLAEGLYLLFRPMDQRILTFGSMEVILVNHMPHPLMFQIFLKRDDELVLKKGDTIPSRQSVILAQLSRKELPEWMQGVLQFLVQPAHTEALMLPVHTGFQITSDRFKIAQSYEHTCLDPGKVVAILLKSVATMQVSGTRKLATPPTIEKPLERVRAISAPQPLPVEPRSDKPTKTENTPLINRFLTPSGDAEVDLHLHHLVPDRFDMTPLEALRCQTGYFQRVLESAILQRVPRLIVVHGVGNGVLKAEVARLAEEIGCVHIYDAPMKQYGVGATVIEFFHTKNEQLRADLM